MRNLKAVLVLGALGAFLALPLRAEIDAQGIKDACAASVLLERSGIPSRVVVAGGEAGCIYTTDGVPYLYTTRGSARINPAHLDLIAPQRVPGAEVYAIGAGHREISNGCLVFATCAYAGYTHNSHIVWAGIIAARIVAATDGYGYADGQDSYGGMKGHALTAFETDQREVFIQENGEEPRKDEHLTELAQDGDRSWCNSGTLAYSDHHIQGFTSFKGECGHPIFGTPPPKTNVNPILEALADFDPLSPPIGDGRYTKKIFPKPQADLDLFSEKNAQALAKEDY
jgi:hypothetical protein